MPSGPSADSAEACPHQTDSGRRPRRERHTNDDAAAKLDHRAAARRLLTPALTSVNTYVPANKMRARFTSGGLTCQFSNQLQAGPVSSGRRLTNGSRVRGTEVGEEAGRRKNRK